MVMAFDWHELCGADYSNVAAVDVRSPIIQGANIHSWETLAGLPTTSQNNPFAVRQVCPHMTGALWCPADHLPLAESNILMQHPAQVTQSQQSGFVLSRKPLTYTLST